MVSVWYNYQFQRVCNEAVFKSAGSTWSDCKSDQTGYIHNRKKSEQKVCRIEQKCIPLHWVERTAHTGLRLPDNSKLRKASIIRSPHNIIHC